MKPNLTHLGTISACILLIGIHADAATLQAFARNGVDVGSGANNPGNGAAWSDPDENGPPYFPGKTEASPVGTVTTALIANDSTGATPATFTYRITDTATGVDFTINQVVTAFAGTPGSYSNVNMRTYTQVDGPSDNRNRTEFVTGAGGHEYWRTAFDLGSITVNSAHTVTFASWDQVDFKAIDSGSTGEIRASGGTNDPGAGASLLNFSNADSGATVSLTGGTGISSIDWVPTSGAATEGFQSQGWVATFNVQPATGGLLVITGIAPQGGGVFDISLTGDATTNYKLTEAADLNFEASTDVAYGSVLVGTAATATEFTTDGGGKATVRATLAGLRNFVRAETP